MTRDELAKMCEKCNDSYSYNGYYCYNVCGVSAELEELEEGTEEECE